MCDNPLKTRNRINTGHQFSLLQLVCEIARCDMHNVDRRFVQLYKRHQIVTAEIALLSADFAFQIIFHNKKPPLFTICVE